MSVNDEYDHIYWNSVTSTCDSTVRSRCITTPAPAEYRANVRSANKGAVVTPDRFTLNHTRDNYHDTHMLEHLQQRASAGAYSDATPVYGMKAASGPAALRRLRKGKDRPEATVDLHGLTTDRAFDALSSNITFKAAQGVRLLLIITGKGQGVLKDALPRMLRHESVSPFVVCYEEAGAAHGGGGAFYAILRRRTLR